MKEFCEDPTVKERFHAIYKQSSDSIKLISGNKCKDMLDWHPFLSYDKDSARLDIDKRVITFFLDPVDEFGEWPNQTLSKKQTLIRSLVKRGKRLKGSAKEKKIYINVLLCQNSFSMLW